MKPGNIPVLILAFNRPLLTKSLIESISKVRSKRIYFAVDGPRVHNENDLHLVSEVRNLAGLIDWHCEVHTLFRAENIGLKKSMIQALDWVFESEEQAIILEDDCHPIPEFFEFCAETLTKYKNDNRIMQISGTSFVSISGVNNARYYVSAINDIWGWATWKRAWDLFEREVPEHDNQDLQDKLSKYFGDRKIVKWFTRYVEEAASPNSQVWSTQWTLSLIKNMAYTIVPQTNLVANVGFTRDATHLTGDSFKLYAKFKTQKIKSNFNPSNLFVNRTLDSERFALIKATDSNLRLKVQFVAKFRRIIVRFVPANLVEKIRLIKCRNNA